MKSILSSLSICLLLAGIARADHRSEPVTVDRAQLQRDLADLQSQVRTLQNQNRLPGRRGREAVGMGLDQLLQKIDAIQAKLPIPAPPPLPPEGVGAPGAFSENFGDNAARWSLENAECDATVDEGRLELENQSQAGGVCRLYWPIRVQESDSFSAEFDARLEDGDSSKPYGLYFRAPANVSGGSIAYLVAIHGQRGFRILRWDGRWTDLSPWDRSAAIRNGEEWNHFKVDLASGRYLSLTMNGSLLRTVQVEGARASDFSFYVEAPGMEVAFDNLRFTPAPSPFQAPPAYQTPAFQAPPAYRQPPVADPVFNRYCAELAATPGDRSQQVLYLAQKGAYTVNQLVRLLGYVAYDEQRLNLAAAFYSHLVDPERFEAVLAIFPRPEHKVELRRRIGL